jgi:4-cresol dehydrogenase (hydroxylating)
VVLVLERLNRILTVDKDMAYAVVEPGVTYRQLHKYLEDHQIPLWIDCTDGPADGSVMGNALERGIGETPYGDHFGNICGMEVVLPDGSLVQTGGGPLDRYKSWNTYKWGVGPYLEGLFSQANYGIVTKIGMWLMPVPERFVCCIFELSREQDFPAMIDALRRLQHNGALQSKVHIINDVVTLAIISEHPRELLKGEPYFTDRRRRELRGEFNLAPWIFAGGVYGTKQQVKAHIKLIRTELNPLGRMEFIGERKLKVLKALTRFVKESRGGGFRSWLANIVSMRILRKPIGLIEHIPHIHAIEKGYPSDHFVKHAYFKSRRPKPPDDQVDPARDHCGLIWIGPMVPLSGKEVADCLDLCKPIYDKHQLDFTIALMVGNPRTVIALMSIFYDREDPDETSRAESLYFELGRVTQEAGYQQYRTSTIYMDRILDSAPEFRELANRIKNALDPNNILAPGKYGIDGQSGI